MLGRNCTIKVALLEDFDRSGTDEDYKEKVGILQTIYDLRSNAEQAKMDEAHHRDAMKRKMSTVNEDGVDIRLQAIKRKSSDGTVI